MYTYIDNYDDIENYSRIEENISNPFKMWWHTYRAAAAANGSVRSWQVAAVVSC